MKLLHFDLASIFFMRFTREELNAKIRQVGIEDIATVKRMQLEADGEMSLIRRDEPEAVA